MADMLVSMAVIVVISGVARNLVLLERKSSRDRDSGRLPEGNHGDHGELLAGLSGNYQWRLLVTRTSSWPIYEVWHVEKGREWEWIYNTQRAKDTNSRKTRGCMVSGAKMSENHPHWCRSVLNRKVLWTQFRENKTSTDNQGWEGKQTESSLFPECPGRVTVNVRRETGERVHVQQGLGYAVRTLSIGKVLSSRILRQTYIPGMEFGLSEGMECLFTHILIQWII